MLIIFVDALPSSKKFRIEKLQTASLTPNLGYSVNLHNEIFNGKTPDEMGFFGEYIYTPDPSKFEKSIFSILHLIEYVPFKFASLFKIFLRRFFKIRVGQIPFKLIPYFKREGKYPFIGECDSILSRFNCFITDDLKNGLGNRDKIAIEKAKSFINDDIKNSNKNIFVSLCDLDGIGHKYGTSSIEYMNRLKFLEKKISQLIDCYENSNPDQAVIVLSDHGMTDTDDFIDPSNVIKELSKKYSLKFFYDSLYMHVFIDKFSEETTSNIKSYIKSNLPVHCFSDVERKKYGITNKRFGDIVFVINNKLAFSPNLFGFLKMKAYHGYLPESSDNKGVFLHKNIKSEIHNNNVSSIEANKIIIDSL